MKKIRTGIIYTPQEFRLLNQCVRCGHALQIPKGEQCKKCKELNLPICKICEIVLRNGVHKFYTYDNKDNHRDTGVQLLASKEMIREFSYEKESSYPQEEGSEICSGCAMIDYSSVKDICYWCDNDFNNSVEHYHKYGNTCEQCVPEHYPKEIYG
jgi:hypothetical protein